MSSWFFTEKTFSRAEVLGCICVTSFQTHDYKYNRTAFLLTERRSSSVTFKTWVRFPSAPPREHMSFSDRLSILERLPVHQRMTARDNAGKKHTKKPKKTKQERHEHFNKDWDKDLWE